VHSGLYERDKVYTRQRKKIETEEQGG
jgi:hypothetical protein